jgi:molybdopterin synthase sulfur carrier subunit
VDNIVTGNGMFAVFSEDLFYQRAFVLELFLAIGGLSGLHYLKSLKSESLSIYMGPIVMIKIEFYSLLRMLLKREKFELSVCDNENVGQLLQRLQQQISTPFLHKLLDEQADLLLGTIILVNRRNIHHLEKLETPVLDGDVVAFFPPGAGG